METVKRIEIIVNYVELSKVLEGLEKSGVQGYTIIRDVAGKSDHGNHSQDLAMTMLDNVYILAFCKPDLLNAIANNVGVVLNRYGGSCFISDSLELQTTRCVG
jgi:nitrogen regulatory protein PII